MSRLTVLPWPRSLPWWFARSSTLERSLQSFSSARGNNHHELETVDDCVEENWTRARQLRRSSRRRAKELAYRLEYCGAGAPCLSRACAQCSLAFRTKMTRQTLDLFADAVRLHFVTVLIPAHVALSTPKKPGIPQLPRSPRRLIAWLRRAVRKHGLGGATMIGGLEVDYDKIDQEFQLHVHLVTDAEEGELTQFKSGMGKQFGGEAVEFQPIDEGDRGRVISYCYKCHATLKGVRKFWKNSKKRLTGDLNRRILQWFDRFRHDDFVFVQGARRFRGGLKKLKNHQNLCATIVL